MKQKLLLAGIALMLCLTSFAQNSPQYYVTIGVYGVHSYAIRNTELAKKNNFNAAYALNPDRKLYYVYIMSSPDKATAIAFMLKTRVETDFKSAWVFKGVLGENGITETPDKPVEKPTEPVVAEKPVVVEKPVEVPPVKKDSAITAVAPSDSVKLVITPPAVVEKPVEKPVAPAGTTPFFFKLVNAESGADIIGEIHVQESAKASQYQAFRGNEVVYIKPPVNQNGTYILVTQAPGYQQIKETIVFKDPGAVATKGTGNEYIIPLELKRAKHGDYIDFNNVKFIRNSSIMLAESQTELDGLVLLMKENPKYKIKVHGHVNGKADREITLRGTSTQFFQPDPAHNKKETSSAQKLSEARAISVKDYIVSQGIEASRITVKGEAAKIPLYGPTSTLAGYNDRVEVEIKKN